MTRIHVKFKLEGKRFGVCHAGRLRGINRSLILYQYDGEEWNRLEDDSQEKATGRPVGELSDGQLKQWGENKAAWYV